VTGADVDAQVLAVARANAGRAGARIAFRERSLAAWQADGVRRMVVTNPPYDVRLGADAAFCRTIAAALSRMHGSRVGLLAGNPEYRRAMPLRPEAVFPLKNGDLPCELLVYEVP
jgi:23S rRNA G2445 N2-methylase RlmL